MELTSQPRYPRFGYHRNDLTYRDHQFPIHHTIATLATERSSSTHSEYSVYSSVSESSSPAPIHGEVASGHEAQRDNDSLVELDTMNQPTSDDKVDAMEIDGPEQQFDAVGTPSRSASVPVLETATISSDATAAKRPNTSAGTGIVAGGQGAFGSFRVATFFNANAEAMKAGTRRASKVDVDMSVSSPVPRPASVPVGIEGSMGVKNGSGVELSASPIEERMRGVSVDFGAQAMISGSNGQPRPLQPLSRPPYTAFTSQPEATSLSNTAVAQPRVTASGIPIATMTVPTSTTALFSKPTPSAPSAHAGFGVLELTSNVANGTNSLVPAGEFTLQRDGRVRNPIPRKLKGKTDFRNGNFGVMHMDFSGTSHLPRAQAAQLTSESTMRAAARAGRARGVGRPPKRQRLEGEGEWLPIINRAQAPILQNNVMPGTGLERPREVVHRAAMMTPEETKYEQARLLTTLRSINPLTVVDQICKALAFFGGIPGAPPPPSIDAFPDSADANGSGALFVGWLSEIFPDVDRREWAWGNQPNPQGEIAPVKRPRGRPKGSKASKARKDKGVRKGKGVQIDDEDEVVQQPAGGDDDDPDWIDVADDQELPAQSTASAALAALEGSGAQTMGGAANGTPLEKRRPGRPRGSKNRQRIYDEDGNEIMTVEVPSPILPALSTQPDGSAQNNLETPAKRKRGRPPGSKTQKLKDHPQIAQAAWASAALTTRATSAAVDPNAGLKGLSQEERAVIEALRKNKALVAAQNQPQQHLQAPAPTPAQRQWSTQATPATGGKRKRGRPKKPRKPLQGEAIMNAAPEPMAGGDTPTMLALQLGAESGDQVQHQAQQAPAPAPIVPTPKKRGRPKKVKATEAAASSAPTTVDASQNPNQGFDANIDPNLHVSPQFTHAQSPQQQQHSRQPSQSGRHNSMSNPYTSGNTLTSIEEMMRPPSSFTPTQPQSTHQSRPQPQGLEAHYERFAALQDTRQNSLDSTNPQSQRNSQTKSPMQSGWNAYNSPQSQSQTQNQSQTRAVPQRSGSGQSLQNQQQQKSYTPSQQQQYHTGYATPAQAAQVAGRQSIHYKPKSVSDYRTQVQLQNQNATSQTGQQQGQQQGQRKGYSQQGQGFYESPSSGMGTGFVNPPALEGYRGMSAGAGAGAGAFGGGFETGGLSDAELRERLLRGMGGRR